MSDLHRGLFGEAGVAARFSDRARLQAMLDVEAVLADAEAEVGVIPRSAIAAIRAAVRAEHYDLDAIAREAASAGNVAIPLVRHLTARVAAVERVAVETRRRATQTRAFSTPAPSTTTVRRVPTRSPCKPSRRS